MSNKSASENPASDFSSVLREHDRRLVELQSLFELSKTLNSSLNLKAILDTLLYTPMGRLLIAQGAVLLNGEQASFEFRVIKGVTRELLGKRLRIDHQWSEPIPVAELSDGTARVYLQKYGFELISPLMSNNACIGLILLGKKISGTPFTQNEIEYLASMANLAAPAIENSRYINELQDVNRQLDKKIQELNTLFDISKELNATLDRDKIANTLAYAIMGEMMVQKILIFLVNSEGAYKLQVSKGFRIQEESSLFDEAFVQKKLAICKKAARLDEIEDAELLEAMQAVGLEIVVPMSSQEMVKGCIFIGGRLSTEPFKQEELEFLSTLGNSAMISLENARLFQETIEKERLEEELSIARDIQNGLLPKVPPQVPGFAFAGLNIPSLQVGGDYYDCFQISEQRVVLAIGDVSGKGVGASLLMANLQASLHALIDTGLSLAQIVQRINNIAHKNTPFDKFITFFVALVDTQKKDLVYVNAGHNPPYLQHTDGSFEVLDAGGLILGMMPDVPYEMGHVAMQAGDTLLMFTDGVSEAMNEAGEEFEEHRIEAFLQKAGHMEIAALVDALHDAVREFCGTAPQSDDITILAMRVLDA